MRPRRQCLAVRRGANWLVISVVRFTNDVLLLTLLQSFVRFLQGVILVLKQQRVLTGFDGFVVLKHVSRSICRAGIDLSEARHNL